MSTAPRGGSRQADKATTASNRSPGASGLAAVRRPGLPVPPRHVAPRLSADLRDHVFRDVRPPDAARV
jgi:hypothetical protein